MSLITPAVLICIANLKGKVENALFDAVQTEVTEKLNSKERVPVNRYFSGSPVYPEKFSTVWNRSYSPAVGIRDLEH